MLIRLRRRRVPPGVPQAHVPLSGIFGFLATSEFKVSLAWPGRSA